VPVRRPLLAETSRSSRPRHGLAPFRREGSALLLVFHVGVGSTGSHRLPILTCGRRPLDRGPENVFESIVNSLRPLAQPSPSVIGVEWWFSVTLTNSTPQWLLPCHFDRNDLDEKDLQKIRHPETASVLFLTSVAYGELVVTDQVLTDQGAHPQQPKNMRFVSPKANRYATFPGHLYHGVIGRMWRPVKDTKPRITMAVNWWTEMPEVAYLTDSRVCMTALRLKA
jgi:hypothetical protein